MTDDGSYTKEDMERVYQYPDGKSHKSQMDKSSGGETAKLILGYNELVIKRSFV